MVFFLEYFISKQSGINLIASGIIIFMSLREEVAKSNAIFTIGRIISVILGFFYSIILARMMQPYNFGLYSFCLVVVGFFILFTDLGLKNILTRFVSNYMSRKEYGKLRSLSTKIFKYKLFLSIFAGFIVFILSDDIALFIFGKPETGFVISFAGVIILFNSILKFFHSLFSGLKKFGAFVSLDILENIFKFIFVIGATVIGMGISGALLGLIITYILLVIISSLFVYKKYRFVFSGPKGTLKKDILVNFGKWIFISSIVDRVYGVVDQMMISTMLIVESIGFYRIAQTWMSSIIYIVPIAGTVLHPYFSGAKNDEQLKSMFFHTFRYASIFIFPLAICLSAYSVPITSLFYGRSFMGAAPALSILAFNSILLCFHSLLLGYFVGVGRPDITTKISSSTIILNIILNYFLIIYYGLIGAAISTIVSLLLNVSVLFYIAIRKKGMLFDPEIILKPLFSSAAVYILSKLFLVKYVFSFLTLIILGIVSVAIYVVLMLLIRGIKKDDIEHSIKGFKNVLKFKN